jgi:Leucine Rich repeat
MASESSVTDRLCSNDPTFVKLHLVQDPAEYFTREEEEQDNGQTSSDDHVKKKIVKKNNVMIPFRAFLEALRNNTSVTYVFLERRFVRGLQRTSSRGAAEYADILHAIGRMPNVREVEIWSVHVPLSTLCAALGQSRRLDRLGLGMVTLVETEQCQGLAHHATLQTFYLSDFRLLENEPVQGQGAEEEATSNTATNNLDSLLQALGTCPRLAMVEIVNHQNDAADADENNNNNNNNHHQRWSSSPRALAALASSTSLVHLTLRRVSLQAAHATALAGAVSAGVADAPSAAAATDDQYDDDARRRRLRVLHLDENHLGNVGSIAIVQAIVDYSSRHRGRNRGGGGVKDLSLRNNQIDATGCVAIADALLQQQAHQEVVVIASSSGANDDDGEEEEYERESCLLEKLNLAMNPIEDRGGAALARLLLQHHHQLRPLGGLKQLELSRANMTDVGCCALAEATRDNTSLLVLGLSFNRMKDATYIAFAASLKVNSTLQSINLVSESLFIACLRKVAQRNILTNTLTFF